ncbi:MAG: PAS domain S-box protein [Chryseolinea sp.]
MSQENQETFESKGDLKDKALNGSATISEAHFDVIHQLRAAQQDLIDANFNLKQSENRLLEAQAIAKVGSWEIDLRTNKASWSSETYRIFEVQLPEEQLTIGTILTYVHEDDVQDAKERFERSFETNEPNKSQHRIIAGTGAVKWIEERWQIFRDLQGCPIRAVGTCQDITERISDAKKIKKANEQLALSQRIARLGYYEESLIDSNHCWSDQMHSLFETSGDLAPGYATFLDKVQEDDRHLLNEKRLAAIKFNKPLHAEFRFITGDGLTKYFITTGNVVRDENGDAIRLEGTVQDITELKKAEQQIRAEKKFSDTLIDSLPGIFYLYDKEGVFTRWNKKLEARSGFSSEEIAAMHPLDFYDENDRKFIQGRIETGVAEGSDEFTAYFYSKDKKKVPYHFSEHKVSLNNKDYLVRVGIDVSLSVKREQDLISSAREIKKLTTHLEHVREEERTRISREIHDELGQQITCLKMDASWLSRKIPLDEKSAHDKLNSMIAMLDNTVRTIRRISSDLRPAVLDNLGLVPALEWQSREFEKNTGMHCAFNAKAAEITVERSVATGIFRIYQEALTNITRHAKATHVEAVIGTSEEFVTLTVKDNGQGFNPAEAGSKETLGLIGMRERAAMMGGDLRIESLPGRGTHVLLNIPLANDFNIPDS